MSMSRVRELGKKVATSSAALRLPSGQRVPIRRNSWPRPRATRCFCKDCVRILAAHDEITRLLVRERIGKARMANRLMVRSGELPTFLDQVGRQMPKIGA